MPVIAVAPGDLRVRGPQRLTASGPAILVGVSVLALTGTSVALALEKPMPVGAGALTMAGAEPTLAIASSTILATPSAAALVVTGYAPDAVIGVDRAIAVPAGTLRFKGPGSPAPTFALPTGELTLTGPAPSLVFPLTQVDVGTLTLTGYAPTLVSVQNAIVVPTGELHLVGQFVGQGFGSILPGALVFTGRAPILSFGIVRPTPIRALTLTGPAPGYVVSAVPQPFVAALALTGSAPIALVNAITIIPTGALGFAGPIPQAVIGPIASPTITIPVGALHLVGQTPSRQGVASISPGAGSATFTGRAPTLLVVGISVTRAVPTGALTATGTTPTLTYFWVVSPAPARLVLRGPDPSIGPGVSGYPAWQAPIIAGGGGA
jgi:hypothetical protein